MEIPEGFAVIESGLFRARFAPDYVFPFLRTLDLKTLIVLDSGTPSRSLNEFAAENGINIVHLVTESWRSIHEIQQQRLTTNILSQALKYTLDQRNYPVMILGSNLLTGVIRKLENWSLFSILNDYNAYSEISSIRANPFGSIFLEFAGFVYTNSEEYYKSKIPEDYMRSVESPSYLINVELPDDRENRPDWVRRFEIGDGIKY